MKCYFIVYFCIATTRAKQIIQNIIVEQENNRDIQMNLVVERIGVLRKVAPSSVTVTNFTPICRRTAFNWHHNEQITLTFNEMEETE